MVQIKRLFHIFIVVALLLGFSSCGKKGSNDFLEINLKEKTPVQIIYRQAVYNGFISFDGTRLDLIIRSNNDAGGSDIADVVFCVDSLVCSVTHQGLEKVFDKEKLSRDFLPMIIYSFVCSTGNSFTANIYEDKGDLFYAIRQVHSYQVTFQAKPNEIGFVYTIIIE